MFIPFIYDSWESHGGYTFLFFFFFLICCNENNSFAGQGRENLISQHQCEAAAQIFIPTDMKTEKLERGKNKHHKDALIFCFNMAVLHLKIYTMLTGNKGGGFLQD